MKKTLIIMGIAAFAVTAYIYYPRDFFPVPFDHALLSFRFDDGFASQEKALVYLAEKKMPGTIFITDAATGKRGYMTRQTIRQMQKLGHQKGFHSRHHHRLLFFGGEGHLREISPQNTETGPPQQVFAYPYGLYNPLFLKQVQQKYRGACAYPILRRGSFNGKGQDRHFIDCIEITSFRDFESLIKKSIEKKLWFVACFHRISRNVSPYSISLEEFKKIADLVWLKKKKKGIRVITLSRGIEIITADNEKNPAVMIK